MASYDKQTAAPVDGYTEVGNLWDKYGANGQELADAYAQHAYTAAARGVAPLTRDQWAAKYVRPSRIPGGLAQVLTATGYTNAPSTGIPAYAGYRSSNQDDRMLQVFDNRDSIIKNAIAKYGQAGMYQDPQMLMLRSMSNGKSNAIISQYGSYAAWEAAGRPPYEYLGRVWQGKGYTPLPDGWRKPSFADPATQITRPEGREPRRRDRQAGTRGRGLRREDASRTGTGLLTARPDFGVNPQPAPEVPLKQEAKPTTLDRAAPFAQARAAIAGQEGTRTPNPTNNFTEAQDRQRTQFRSQRSGYSGNRRFHPFAGA